MAMTSKSITSLARAGARCPPSMAAASNPFPRTRNVATLASFKIPRVSNEPNVGVTWWYGAEWCGMLIVL